MKTSEILIQAKGILAKNWAQTRQAKKQIYLCYAIRSANRTPEEKRIGLAFGEKNAATRLIEKRLGPCPSLDMWLHFHHDVDVEYESKEYVNRTQVTRHAWLDSLIAEFQAKGD